MTNGREKEAGRLIELGKASRRLYRSQRNIKYGLINKDKRVMSKAKIFWKGTSTDTRDSRKESRLLLVSWLLFSLQWSVHSLCFFKPVIWARGYKAFPSSETSLNTTSSHRLRRDKKCRALNRRGFHLGIRPN